MLSSSPSYYFVKVKYENGKESIQGYDGGPYCENNNGCTVFTPPDQQKDLTYYQYGVFWLYNWFQADNNMNIFFLMNGNIYNYSLALEPCSLNGRKLYAIPPNPPTSTSTITGECKPIFAQSYINAYNTAFNQQTSGYNLNYQVALNKYSRFAYDDVNSNFVPGTFGYDEEYNTPSQLFYINYLQDDASVYVRTPYLFVSTGSGGGSGFMYLDWIIVTYGVPYIVNIS